MRPEWRLHMGRSGLPSLIFIDGQHTCHLHSLYNPIREAASLVSSWNIDESVHTVTVVGLGLGYHLSACLNRFPWLQKIEVLESHTEVYRLAKENFPKLMGDPRVTVHLTPDEATFQQAFGQVDIRYLQLHPPSVSVIPFERIRMLIQELQMIRTTTENQSSRLLENWLHNRASLQAGPIYSDKRNSWAGRPGILVAAGPSLDNSLDFLHQHRRDAIVVAVSTAMRTIYRSGIVPDYCIVSDSSQKIADHFMGIEGANLPELLLLSTVHPSLSTRYQGKATWLLQKGFDPAEDFANEGGYDLFETGGSVATLALSTLYYMGCNPIVFVGQDLAYISGRTHTNGAHEELQQMERPSISTVSVPSVDGIPIWSNLSWNSFRHWIEQFIASHPDRTYINASAGAHIRGTVVRKHSQTGALTAQ